MGYIYLRNPMFSFRNTGGNRLTTKRAAPRLGGCWSPLYWRRSLGLWVTWRSTAPIGVTVTNSNVTFASREVLITSAQARGTVSPAIGRSDSAGSQPFPAEPSGGWAEHRLPRLSDQLGARRENYPARSTCGSSRLTGTAGDVLPPPNSSYTQRRRGKSAASSDCPDNLQSDFVISNRNSE